MKAAPAFDCASCGCYIKRNALHNLLEDNRVLCIHCMYKGDVLHPRFYPDCAVPSHNLLDHAWRGGTRTVAARLLGLWPDPQS